MNKLIDSYKNLIVKVEKQLESSVPGRFKRGIFGEKKVGNKNEEKITPKLETFFQNNKLPDNEEKKKKNKTTCKSITRCSIF